MRIDNSEILKWRCTRYMALSVICIIFMLVLQAGAADDTSPYIYLDSPYYDYIDYLINSGQAIPDFVLQQPYRMDSMDSTNTVGAGKYFHTYWGQFYSSALISGQIELQDQYRQTEIGINRFKASGSAHVNTPHVLFANRTVFDQQYKNDPKYAGDLSESENWLYGRVNDAYMQLNYKGIGLFVGRMQRNWGAVKELGLILSSHPYTYDHFMFNYQYKKIRFSLIFARLEDLTAQEIISKNDSATVIESARKFLIGHRFDFMFSRKFQAAITEMATYGGEDRDFEFAFFNPMNFYYGIQRNDHKQMNGLWTLDIFYKPVTKLTFYGQLLIDDYIVNNEPGKNDRTQYPDRLGTLVSVRTGDFMAAGLNTAVTYVRIWNRSYQSIRTYENYHYRELGLGYACASCEEVKMKLSYWNLFPWVFTDELVIGRYGDVQLTDLFMLNRENFPVAPVLRNIANQCTIHYYPHTRLSLWLKALYIKEKDYYANRIDPFKGFALKLGIQVLLSGGFDL
jgi:hypothetical protein